MFFFFKQKTAYEMRISDWSSDVCSSDLLSITRWDPISGVIPPLNQADWQHQFDLYKQTPQYQTVNRNMTMSDFQFIFFWEYIHRLLGRLIGVAFALPFAWFAWQRDIPKGFGWRLTIIFALGALQGAIGWWMVVSGLVERTEVSHIRLAVHLRNARSDRRRVGKECVMTVRYEWSPDLIKK